MIERPLSSTSLIWRRLIALVAIAVTPLGVVLATLLGFRPNTEGVRVVGEFDGQRAFRDLRRIVSFGPKLFVDLAERCENFLFAKLEVTLPGSKCAEIIRLSRGKLQVLYGLGGIAMIDGLEHGACGIMPGPALVEAYARIFELWDGGEFDRAKALFYQLQPYLVFALQHLELAVQIEKRVMMRRGVFPSDGAREPTLRLDEAYQKQMDELVDTVAGLAEDAKAAAQSSPNHSSRR